jgi:YesN/AraC family two-component response regulator
LILVIIIDLRRMIPEIYFPKQNIDEIYRHHELEQALIEKVVNGEITEAVRVYNLLLSGDLAYELSNRCRLYSLKNHMLSMIVLLCHHVIKNGVSPYSAKAKSQAFFKLIEDTPSIDELLDLGQKAVMSYAAQIAAQRTEAKDASIVKALNHIHNSLGENLTLEKVAEHVGLSRCYFCTQFKKETGLSFSHYLTLARIQKSKYLLANSQKPILDIAILLGFNSQNYFTTQFKKYVGLSPKKYRNSFGEQRKV